MLMAALPWLNQAYCEAASLTPCGIVPASNSSLKKVTPLMTSGEFSAGLPFLE
jgi:hypothetical protein